jgi:superfamily II DNA or RNA helicase
LKQIVKIAFNAIDAKVTPVDPTQLTAVKDVVTKVLSYVVLGHERMNTFSQGGWNGRSSFFARRTCMFPAGFVHMVQHELTRKGYQVMLARRPLPAPLGPENPIVDEFGNDDPRYDFQMKAVRQVEKHGRGIIRVATGGGKSKIAKLITARYRRPTLFITTRGVLMYQMKDAFENDCKFNVGVIGDGQFTPTKGINVGMVQTLVSQLEEPKLEAERLEIVRQDAVKELNLTREQIAALGQHHYDQKVKIRNRLIKFLEMIEVVIGEEAHEAGGNSYYEILRWCKNAHIRVALTATPFMRGNEEDNMRLMAAFGPILLTVSEETLIKRGVLARPYFLFADVPPAAKLRKSSPWQRAYQLGITESETRNGHVVQMAKKAKAHGLSTLILVQRKAHGPILVKMLRAAGLTVRQIQGENDQAERKKALNDLASGALDVLIGTTIVDVGVDVPAIGLVILAGGGKAEVAHRQRIGRGLRAKKKGPNVAFIVDYTDSLNSTLRDHAKERRAIVETTPGFVEGIVAANDDLPWHLFNMRKAA